MVLNNRADSTAAIQVYANLNTLYDLFPNCYWNITANLFQLWVGLNYKKNKNKELSAPALYNLYAMDIINSLSTLKYVKNCFKLPDIPEVIDLYTRHKYILPIIVIHASIAVKEPSIL